MTRTAAVLVFAATLLSEPALAQPPTRRVFVEATHASGGAVVDLKPADFQITEGGETREVSSATLTRRPARIVLIVDATEAIRQPIGQIRTALATFLEAIDAQHEMMFVTVAGTPQIRVQPTADRAAMVKIARDFFGTSGANTMHRTIDDIFHRFGQTTDHRPVFVVVTAEPFESTANINPQQIKHLADHFISRGGTLARRQAERADERSDVPRRESDRAAGDVDGGPRQRRHLYRHVCKRSAGGAAAPGCRHQRSPQSPRR